MQKLMPLFLLQKQVAWGREGSIVRFPRPVHGASKATSPETVGAREAAGNEAAGGAAGAAPRGQVDFGASTVLALAPR